MRLVTSQEKAIGELSMGRELLQVRLQAGVTFKSVAGMTRACSLFCCVPAAVTTPWKS